MKSKVDFYCGHSGSGKSEIEKITIIEKLFNNFSLPRSNGIHFIAGTSGSGKSFYNAIPKIKPVSNNWRKMHGKPMLRKKNGMKRTEYWKQQLSFLL